MTFHIYNYRIERRRGFNQLSKRKNNVVNKYCTYLFIRDIPFLHAIIVRRVVRYLITTPHLVSNATQIVTAIAFFQPGSLLSFI